MSVAQSRNVDVSQIFTSRKIVLELMERLGYNVDEYKNFSQNEVSAMGGQLDMLLEHTDSDHVGKVYITYQLQSRPNIQDIIDDLYVLSHTLTREDTLFIIMKSEPNDTLMAQVKHIWETDGRFLVVENMRRLQFNILEHTLVPPHRVMKDEEVTAVMKRYNIADMGQFPEISRFDPVARVICLRPGQVCHILRPSKTAVLADYYRVCV